MTRAAFSPAPWRALPRARSDFRGMLVHARAIHDAEGRPVGEMNADADCRLVTATPDLLAVAVALRDAYAAGEACGGSVEWHDLDRAHTLALSVLARIGGAK